MSKNTTNTAWRKLAASPSLCDEIRVVLIKEKRPEGPDFNRQQVSVELSSAIFGARNEIRTGAPYTDLHRDKWSNFFVGVNVGVFFRHEKAQPFQIGLSH